MKKDMVIAVCFPLDESHRSILQKNARGAKVVYSGDPEYPNALKEAEIIFGNPELSELKSTNRLKLLQLASAGAEHYVAPGVLPDGAVLANASGAYGASIAEYMLCMVMNLFLDLPRYRDQQRRHIWKESKICRHIPGIPRSSSGSATSAASLRAATGPWADMSSALSGRRPRNRIIWTSSSRKILWTNSFRGPMWSRQASLPHRRPGICSTGRNFHG